jgi:DNA-binding NarL/FixJ family response regulator
VANSTPEASLISLTVREFDIFRVLGQGKNYAQIAEQRGVSYKAIANSTRVMKKKLSVETMADLIRSERVVRGQQLFLRRPGVLPTTRQLGATRRGVASAGRRPGAD